MERLDKILSNSGFGTRKEVKQLIKQGAVTVDGLVATSPESKVEPSASAIAVNGVVLEYKEFVYLMLNKPDGYVSATYDNYKPTVVELVPEEYAHLKLFPVGRLDIDTEGLLILTNDGDFAHRVLSPKKHIPKKYYARTARSVTGQDQDAFSKPMDLGDFTTIPGMLEPCDGGGIVTIYEGKFHQVKRMFEHTGNSVTYLKRMQMGNLELDESLAPGACRELTEEELDKLWK